MVKFDPFMGPNWLFSKYPNWLFSNVFCGTWNFTSPSLYFPCMAVCVKWNELWGSEAIILASLIESSEAQAVAVVQGRVRSIMLRCSTYTKMLSDLEVQDT